MTWQRHAIDIVTDDDEGFYSWGCECGDGGTADSLAELAKAIKLHAPDLADRLVLGAVLSEPVDS